MYNAEEYRSVKSLVEQNKWYQIKETDRKNVSFGEYLDIVTFLDKGGKKYIATIFDSEDILCKVNFSERFFLMKPCEFNPEANPTAE